MQSLQDNSPILCSMIRNKPHSCISVFLGVASGTLQIWTIWVLAALLLQKVKSSCVLKVTNKWGQYCDGELPAEIWNLLFVQAIRYLQFLLRLYILPPVWTSKLNTEKSDISRWMFSPYRHEYTMEGKIQTNWRKMAASLTTVILYSYWDGATQKTSLALTIK